jgi:multidrug resistance efflux pump
MVAVTGFLTTMPQARPIKDPEQKDGAKVLQLPGTVEPAEQTPMYPRITGFVQKVNVDIGDRVKKGDVLAELSVPEMEAEQKQKQALVVLAEVDIQHAQLMLKESKTALDAAASQVKEAEANHGSAQATAENVQAKLERVKALVGQNNVSESILKEAAEQLTSANYAAAQAKSKVETAKANREQSSVKVELAENGVKRAEAQRDAAKADLQRTAALLQYAKIVAPYDGVIARRNVATGDLAGPPDARGEWLFAVMRVDTVRVVVVVPQGDVTNLKIGTEAVVNIGDQKFKGKVTRKAAALDAQKHTLHVEIDLANPDGKLLPGMACNVSISAAQD